MNRPVDAVARELLVNGLLDWVPADWLINEVRRSRADDIEGNFRHVLVGLGERSLIELGEIGDEGFVAWDTNSTGQVERALAIMNACDWIPELDGFWIANTEAGDEIARRLLAGEDVDLG